MLDHFIHAGFFLILSVTIIHSSLPMFYYDLEQNSVLTLPDGIAEEDELVRIDRLILWIVMALWFAFVAVYIVIFAKRRINTATEFSHQSREEMKLAPTVQDIKRQGVFAWGPSSSNSSSKMVWPNTVFQACTIREPQ
eukprot:SAG31_NODE_4052_length_3634_cov_2.642716_3_plen_138_part_00